MRKIFKFLIVFLIGIFSIPIISFAHPGRTDSSGCHTCRTNCPSWGLSYNEYHCHRAKASPQPKEPIKSIYGENGTGYTTPAPEYKISNNTDLLKASINQNIKKESKQNFWQKVLHWFGRNK